MTTQFFKRPSAAYTGEAGLPNRTKYNDDSTASPRRPISSTKVDGDINYLVDAVNVLYDTAVSGVVADNSITNAKLRDSSALSVIGRSANTSGDPADIVAANDGEVLRRSGTSVGFGTIGTSGIADAAITAVKIADTNVTFAKIQNVNTATILGRSSSGAGSVEALTLGSNISLTSGVLSGPSTATTTSEGVVELATDAEVRTATDTVRPAPVSAMGAHPGMAKAWFCGTISGGVLTTQASYNCSVVRNSAGRFTVTFTTALQDANYVPIGMIQVVSTLSVIYVPNGGTKTTTTLQLATDVAAGGATDTAAIYFAVFGN